MSYKLILLKHIIFSPIFLSVTFIAVFLQRQFISSSWIKIPEAENYLSLGSELPCKSQYIPVLGDISHRKMSRRHLREIWIIPACFA